MFAYRRIVKRVGETEIKADSVPDPETETRREREVETNTETEEERETVNTNTTKRRAADESAVAAAARGGQSIRRELRGLRCEECKDDNNAWPFTLLSFITHEFMWYSSETCQE